jgi:hypothetical protein
LSSSRTIHEWYAQTLEDFPGYSRVLFIATLNLAGSQTALRCGTTT